MKLLCQGKPVTNGTAAGRIVSLSKEGCPAQNKIDKGCILLLENSSPIYAVFIMNAGGVIIKEGGILAHTCLLAIEMSIPCITQVGADISIKDGTSVILNADEGKVYEC